MQLSLFLLQAIAASAAAIASRSETPLDKREDWTGDGNVEIYVSDARVSWGSLIPSSIVADALYEKCGNNGCDTNWSFESRFADAAKDWNAKVTFTMADDNYPTWQKNGLISLLESTIAEVAEQKVVNMKKCHSYDPRRPCSSEVEKIDQYWAPQTISIQIPASDGVEAVDMRIGIEIEEREDPIFGLCTLTAGFGGSIASLVQPYLGPAFALGTFGCVAAA